MIHLRTGKAVLDLSLPPDVSVRQASMYIAELTGELAWWHSDWRLFEMSNEEPPQIGGMIDPDDSCSVLENRTLVLAMSDLVPIWN